MAIQTVEERWVARHGAGTIEVLRRTLAPGNDVLPWSPPEVHPSDGFRTAVVGGSALDFEVPLVASLGRALTAVTLAYEQGSAVSLPLGANLLPAIGSVPDGIRTRDLPEQTGLSREAISMALRWLERAGLAGSGGAHAASLTDAGRRALADHERRIESIDDAELRGALESIVSRPEILALGLRPPDDGWRSKPPYLAQTRRLLADPLGTLPRHPMVLHRGGWPDGS